MSVRSAGVLILVGAVAAAAFAGASCGSSSDNGYPDAGGGNRDGTAGDVAPPLGGDGSLGDGQVGALVIQPANPVLTMTVPGPMVTQQFKALEAGSVVVANWSVDNPQIGSLSGNGLFTASGTVGGQANVTALAGNMMATTTVTVKLSVTENPGNVPVATQGQLTNGGSADAAFRWLYPYDQTIFPRGLTSPALQFDGVAPDAVYVHVTSTNLDYKGFYGASNPGQVTFSAATWTLITESAGPGDAVKVDVTKISAGAVTGPKTETWKVAQGSLKGTVYYNSYDSPQGAGNGAVLQMKPGIPATVLVGGSVGCQVCHAVSADGSLLAADGPGDVSSSYVSGSSYGLTPSAGGTTSAAKLQSVSSSTFAFGGIYPDGSLLLTNASLGGGWPPNVPGVGNSGAMASQLLNPRTGAVVPAPGFDGVVGNALMPSFSPDGKKVAFNHYDVSQGHTLAVMDFAKASNTFSGLVDVTNDPSSFLGWPAFLPDSAEFVFHADDASDFATWQSQHATIKMVDLATKTVTPLDTLNGLANGQPYLPQGASELNLNYEPTALPVAVGGYYWVVFTSRRYYGNTINPTNAPDPWGNANRKKLWVAAIDLMPTPGKDPSHPAFYINDQELAAGNMRGFWALDPCKQNGNSCNSGDECCTGFCRQVNGEGGSALQCVPPQMGCAQEYEKCNVTADCCGAAQGFLCINGHCAQPTPK